MTDEKKQIHELTPMDDETNQAFETNEVESLPERDALSHDESGDEEIIASSFSDGDETPEQMRARWAKEKEDAHRVSEERKKEGLAERGPALEKLTAAKKKLSAAKANRRKARTESEIAAAEEEVSKADTEVLLAEDAMRSVKNKLELSRIKFKKELADKRTILSLRHMRMYFKLGRWPDYVKLKAVHDVSFDIQEGETFGIVGESGCGKSTTGRCILRLYDITSGSIYYKGYRISGGERWHQKEIKYTRIRTKEKVGELENQIKQLSASSGQEGKIAKLKEEIAFLKKKESVIVEHQKEKIRGIRHDNKHSPTELLNEIQMIFQDPVDSLDPRMTVEDIIQEGLKIQGHHNKGENHKKTVEILKRVGLVPEHASRYPHEFSGGQRQRIGIARALIMNPKLLICDEPISALDVSIRAQIINLLNDLKQEMGLTMIFIAHDLSTVKYFCNRIAVMYYGNLVELTTSDELFRHPLHPYSKSLLSAIPQPNPLSEKRRVRIVYNPMATHDYSKQKPRLQEIIPGHFVLCNDEEAAKYRSEIKSIDSGEVVIKNGQEIAAQTTSLKGSKTKTPSPKEKTPSDPIENTDKE